MKIAVTYSNGEIFQHFGHTEQFKVYTVDGRLVAQGEGFIALNKGVYVVQAAQYNTKVVLK